MHGAVEYVWALFEDYMYQISRKYVTRENVYDLTDPSFA